MFIKSLRIKNFRCYYSLNINFSKGLNILVGPNASGKTNLLEAINYLSFTKSFRNIEDKNLIKKNQNDFFIEAIINKNNFDHKINIYFNKIKKQILVNGNSINKLSELNKIANVLVFEPNDVMIFKSYPKERRNFLDLNISKINDNYILNLKNYNNLLKERNELLKNPKLDQIQLEVITKEMIKYEKDIITARNEFVNNLNKVINNLTFQIKGDKDNVLIKYFPFLKITNNFEKEAYELYKTNLESDIKKKATSVGIHLEDFKLYLNNEDISVSGSQGENRILAIILKISPYFLVKEEYNHPIVILDDVLSELDKKHQNLLLKFLEKLEQVFISTTYFNGQANKIINIYNHQIKGGN